MTVGMKSTATSTAKSTDAWPVASTQSGAAVPIAPVVSKRVALIGPSFGAASAHMAEALRSSPRVAELTEYWYDESIFEKPIGRFVSRLLRVLADTFQLGPTNRQRVERISERIRFRRDHARSIIMEQIESMAEFDTLLLVKPMFLRSADADFLRQRAKGTQVIVVLWDALWRTPSIRQLAFGVDAVFTTEVSDCNALIAHLPLPFQVNDAVARRRERSRGEGLFFCGAASLDRIRDSVAVKRAVTELGLVARIHLVTHNVVVGCLIRRLGFSSEAIGRSAYQSELRRCRVVLDLGRVGQGSPSERLADAVHHGKALVTSNPSLGVVGSPVVWIPSFRGSKAELLAAVRKADELVLDDKWEQNEAANALLVSYGEWVRRVLDC